MESRSSATEAWIEEQVALYLNESRSARPKTPEAFVALVLPPEGGEETRRRLLARLRIGEVVERRLTLDQDGELAVGVEVGDFRIEGTLGQGGMGQVFRARQKNLDREVAIKVPHWLAALDPREKARFWREAQAVAQLRHPAIVPLHQVGEHRGMPYLVMELVEGETLAQRLRAIREGAFPRDGHSLAQAESSYERAAARLVLSVAKGLDAAHSEGVVHRDLKPSNLMISRNGEVKILDFGLARRADADTLTRSGELLGTPEYLAPELVRNLRAATPASDVYALGVVLYEILALERPFSGASTPVLLARILDGDPPPLHATKKASKNLSAIVERAMARDLTRRYASVAELAADLEAFLGGREVSARSSGVISRLGRRMRRRPALTGAAAVALIAMSVALLQWRRYAIVKSGDNAREARQLALESLMDEQTDSRTMGVGPTRTEARELAVRDLQRSVELDPTLTEARFHLAVLLASLGRSGEARHELARLPREWSVHEAPTWLQRHIDGGVVVGSRLSPPAEFLDHWERASHVDRFYALRAIHDDPASTALANAIAFTLRSDPLYGPASMFYQALAITVKREGAEDRDMVNATRLYQGALALVPDHPVVAGNLAAELLHMNELNLEALLKKGKPEPDTPPLGVLEAVFTCESALRVHPDREFLWTNYAMALGHAHQHERAVQCLRPGLERFPQDDALVQNWLANVYYALTADSTLPRETLVDAEALVRKRLARRESDAMMHLFGAWILRGLDDVDGVRAHLARVKEIGLPPNMDAQGVSLLEQWLQTQ